MKKICYVVASEMTFNSFLKEQISVVSSYYDVSVVVNTSGSSITKTVNIFPLCIKREISPWEDLKTLFHLIVFFYKEEFDIVLSVTPKAALLAALAGFFTQVPHRVHIYTGQVWVTKKGLARLFFKRIDVLISSLATSLLADSESQRSFLIAEKVVLEKKIGVLKKGSISGVNIKRFRPNPIVRERLRKELNILETDLLFLFLGRLKKDKGVMDLFSAFSSVSRDFTSARLLIVGPDEEGIIPLIKSTFKEDILEKSNFISYTDTPESYMAASDVFCLPSYREGFGSVVIEAAAVGLPAIGTKIYGLIDAIEDGVTGILVEPGEHKPLVNGMNSFLASPEKVSLMGRAAQARACKDFSHNDMAFAWLNYYESLS